MIKTVVSTYGEFIGDVDEGADVVVIKKLAWRTNFAMIINASRNLKVKEIFWLLIK